MEPKVDIAKMDRILEKADRIGVLSEIIDSLNSEEEQPEETGKFICHLSQAITDLSAEIVSIVYEVGFAEISATHKKGKR